MNTKENKPKAKPKKMDLIREIIEIDDRFDTTSLSRTNIANLKLVETWFSRFSLWQGRG